MKPAMTSITALASKREPGGKEKKRTIWRPLWNFLGSAKMAVFLLVLVAFFSALGTFLPQNHSAPIYAKLFGPFWGTLFTALSLNNLYYAPWFIALLCLVALNLILSNVRRLHSLLHDRKGARVALQASSFTESPRSLKMSALKEGDRGEGALKRSLLSMSYSLREERQSEDVFYVAEKGRLRRWGSLVTHIGILIVFLGVIYGHLPGMGFKGIIRLSPGGKISLKEAPGFFVKLLDTGSRTNESGRPVDFYSTVQILEDGKTKREKTIRVNDPLEYRGITFYQSSFGIVGVILKIIRPDRTEDMLPVQLGPGGDPRMDLPLPISDTGIFLYMHHFYPHLGEKEGEIVNLSGNYDNPGAQIFIFENFSMGGQNQWKTKGWVSPGKPMEYKGYKIEMGDLIRYSGFEYKKDAGVPLVWLGFLFTSLGLFLSFYINERTMRILLRRDRGELFVQTHAKPDDDFGREISLLKISQEEK
jgi:cytochrome c biogenesis protein